MADAPVVEAALDDVSPPGEVEAPGRGRLHRDAQAAGHVGTRGLACEPAACSVAQVVSWWWLGVGVPEGSLRRASASVYS